jgi:hypothetical protein
MSLSITPHQGSCTAGSPIVCDLGELAADATAIAGVVVTPTRATKRLYSSASATANEPDGTSNNNTVTRHNEVSPATAKLHVGVTDLADPLRVDPADPDDRGIRGTLR